MSAPGRTPGGTELNPARFRAGIDDANSYLATLPAPWARHHAASTLAEAIAPDGDPSYTRGYRAALHGYLRGCSIP
ncbi:MAG: hypothetical protein QM662_07975 [Gordonia sp. (in: high G+C Gram-positive bacteria)]